MREPIEIFGYPVRPLTVAQVEQIEGIVAGSGAIGTTAAREILAAALSRDHAAVDVAHDIECDVRELSEAMTAVLRLGGFVPPGEAPAAARNDASAPTGEPSADA